MILYYSGTGNSAFAANKIGKVLEDEVESLFDRIRNQDFSEMHSERPWVVVAPTYAWQMPHIVRDWLEKTSLEGSKDVYFVLTCGSSIGNAGGYAKALCEKKGMNYMGCAKIVMPENYIAMFQAPDREKSKEIIKKAAAPLKKTIHHIQKGEPIPERITPLMKLTSSVVNYVFCEYLIKDKKFTVSNDCIACGLCEKACPTGNIILKDGKPTWNGNCTHCMSCICKCPTKAINYGKGTKKKNRYQCPVK